MAHINKRAYAEMFGPTVGDRVRLADTELTLASKAIALQPLAKPATPTHNPA